LAARGKFITLEGGEGAGKSTQARLLAEALRTPRREVVLTREPGGAPGAELIRNLLVRGDRSWDPASEVLLHYAARHEHLVQTVRPALARGAWVVCDRFADSTLAYQGYGLGVDRSLIRRLHRDIVGETDPDLTIILDIDPEEGLARAQWREASVRKSVADDRYERMDIGFHRRLRAGFLAIARHQPGRCVVIDAGRNPETIRKAILAAARERL
jgi:dTMP kinase